MQLDLHQLIATYEENLTNFAKADKKTSQQVISVLLARDRIQNELSKTVALDTASLQRLVWLDNWLRKEMSAVQQITSLSHLRLSQKPKEEGWWWYLDTYLTGVIDAYEWRCCTNRGCEWGMR